MSQGVEDFLEYRRAEGCSVRTLGQYRSVIGRLERDTGSPALGLGPTEVARWLAALDVTPASRATYRAGLVSFYRWARMMGLIPASPMELVPAPRLPRRHPRPIGPAQYRAALAAAPAGSALRVWLLLAGLAGLRRSEAALLEAGDVDLDGGHLLLCHGTKGGHERRVGLHPVLAAELAAWPVEVGRLWRSHPSTVGDKVAAHLRGEGIDATMHNLRHYFGTELYRASGGDLRAVQSALGHASPATTALYTAVVEDLRPMIAAIPA